MRPIESLVEMELYAEAKVLPARPVQHCPECRAVLSRWNPGPRCWPCARTHAISDEPLTPPRAITHPRQWWYPENAVRRQEMQAEFREQVLAAMERLGTFTIPQLADDVACPPNRVRVVLLEAERDGVILRLSPRRQWRDGRRIPLEWR